MNFNALLQVLLNFPLTHVCRVPSWRCFCIVCCQCCPCCGGWIVVLLFGWLPCCCVWVQIGVVICLEPSWGRDRFVLPSLDDPVPWPTLLECWRQLWFYVLEYYTQCFLVVIKWSLSQCRYWSVCIGFPYTIVWMVLFSPGVTLVSKNRIEPSVPGCSTVNCMLGSCELMWWSSCVLCSTFWMTRVLSTNLSQWWGVEGSAKGFTFKLLHEQVGNERADGRTHGCTMGLFIILNLEEEVSIFKAELQ